MTNTPYTSPRDFCDKYNIHHSNLVSKVLTDEKFNIYPASTDKHHTYIGGLRDHTFEVIDGALGLCPDIESREILILSGLFHDFAKTQDYQCEDLYSYVDYTCDNISKAFTKSDHYYKIRHVVSSAMYFDKVSDGLSCIPKQDILHCILSHHGRREWGSPVEPCTKEAWALHLSDMYSARSWEINNKNAKSTKNTGASKDGEGSS